jgi:hypothetical protein
VVISWILQRQSVDFHQSSDELTQGLWATRPSTMSVFLRIEIAFQPGYNSLFFKIKMGEKNFPAAEGG